jgi:peptidoglycan/xylan/chitin deacetylase (PgdA/CDA1 family)
MDRHRTSPPATRLLALLLTGLTWVGLPAAVAAADAPGTCSSASTSPTNTWVRDTIASSADVDWFRFSIATGTRAQLTLGDVPADYDLALYAGCSTLLASSTRPGVEFEEIYRQLPAGAYRVRVTGFDGAHSTAAYALRLRTLAWGMPILSSTEWTDSSGYLHIVGEVLNNTAEPRRWIQVDASLRDGSGAIIRRAVGYPEVPTLQPWTRSPFEIVTRRPAGFARATLVVCTPSAGGCRAGEVAAPPSSSVVISGSGVVVDSSGRRHYTGTFRNAGSTTAHLPRVAVTLYNARGNVRGLASGPAAAQAVAVGASTAYDVIAAGTTSPNRAPALGIADATGCSTGQRYSGAQENLVPPLGRASAGGRVALTFDMGGRMTPAVKILKLLVANRVCATIFPTGAISRTTEGQAALAIVKAHPELFELGNHTMNHCDLVRGGGGAPGAAEAAFCNSLAPSPTEAEVKQELRDGDAWVREYVGMPTSPLWRAPYGVSSATVRAWAAEAGWTKHVDWNIDTIDWKPTSQGGPTARSMTLKVVNGATSGSIVLMHLGGYETLDALQGMIDGLRSRGFALTTVSDLAM